MNVRVLLVLLFVISSTATTFAQHAKLEGRVIDDRDKPVSGLRIIVPGAQAATTDSKGHFIIYFPQSVSPGVPARLQLNSTHWVIYTPMFGQCTTQSLSLNYEELLVRVVPKRSPLALSPKRLNEVISQWAAEKARLTAEVRILKRSYDDTALLRQYAKEYGFTYEQFLVAARRWAVIQEFDDKEERALKEYWQQNFAKSAQLAEESAQMADEELKQAINKTQEVSLKLIRRYILAGNAYSAQSKFKEALEAYRKVDRRFETKELSKENFTIEWAEVKILVGNSMAELGARIEGKDGPQLLTQALSEYEQSATVYTRENSPQRWAELQNNLGLVQMQLGERVGGAESIKLLKDAVLAYRNAIEVFETEKIERNVAWTQSNLGLALSSLGRRVSYADSVPYFEQAVLAYRSALKVMTRSRFPQEWAGIIDNLGIVQSDFGERVGGEESMQYLEEALRSQRAALEVRLRDQDPEAWAGTQTNLGDSLSNLGERVSGDKGVLYLNQAVAAYHAALEVRTRLRSPQDWASTQNNLGLTLTELGERAGDSTRMRHFQDAILAFRVALEVRTREHLPQKWATTQNNLGLVLSSISEHLSDPEAIQSLNSAMNAFQAALEIFTATEFPQDWCDMQNNLGVGLSQLGERTRAEARIEHLNNAVAAYLRAIECKDREKVPQNWADTQHNLGNALLRLGETLKTPAGIEHLKRAVNAYRAAREVRSREHLRHYWVHTQTYLALALLILGERSSGDERSTQIHASLTAFRLVLQETPKQQDLPQSWISIPRRLMEACVDLRDAPCAAEAADHVLTFNMKEKSAYLVASWLYQNALFDFDKAFILHQRWVGDHPNDILAQISFAQSHFSTGRFEECSRYINTLLKDSAVSAGLTAVLRALRISCLLATGNTDAALVNLEALIVETSSGPLDLKVHWAFDGTKRFIEKTEQLSPFRAWLMDLFATFAIKDQAIRLRALEKLRENFKWAGPVREQGSDFDRREVPGPAA